MKKDRGFTLVELVVVIAILGVLAGVAVPVYSGYVKKAHQAADNQLLGAVNTAFAAASMEAGQYDGKPSGGRATIASDGKVTSVTSDVDTSGDLFAKYYAGNENTAFQIYRTLTYNSAKGVFEGVASGDYSKLKYTQAQVDSYKASTYNAMGVDAVMGEVNTPVSALSDLLTNGSNYEKLGDGFLNFVANTLGKDITKLTPEEISNAVVLYVAHETGAKGADKILQDFNEGYFNNFQTMVQGSLAKHGQDFSGAVAELLPDLAMTYGVATAFLNTEAGAAAKTYDDKNLKTYFNEQKELMGKAANGQAAFQILMGMLGAVRGNGDFEAYVEEHGRDDVSGYIAAMELIDSNVTDKTFDTSGLLASGFGDKNLKDALKSILG